MWRGNEEHLGATDTRGVDTHSQVLLHKPPRGFHEKDWGQGSGWEQTILEVCRPGRGESTQKRHKAYQDLSPLQNKILNFGGRAKKEKTPLALGDRQETSLS